MPITTELLSAGNSEFRVVTHGPNVPDDAIDDRVVFANGFLQNPDVLHGLARDLVSHATANGRRMQVTLHDSPVVYTRRKGAQAADQAEVFEKVVEHVSHGERPVRLAGNSNAWPQVVAVATRQLAVGRPIESVLGSNPNGLTPIRDRVALVSMAGVGVREIVTNTALLRGNIAARYLGVNALREVAARPLDALGRGFGILQANVIKDTVMLSEKLAASGESRVRLLSGGADDVCPTSTMRANLQAAGFPLDQLITVPDMNHGDPLTNRKFSRVHYEQLMLHPINNTSDQFDVSL